MSVPPGQTYPPSAPWPSDPPQHPQTTTVLILGVVSAAVLGIVGPFAWYLGSKVLKEIDAHPGRWSGRELVRAGHLMGIVSTFVFPVSMCCLGLYILGELA